MKMNEILDLIRGLARSQGFYGRMYRDIMEIKETNPEGYEELTAEWEAQNFKEPLDFILYCEQ